MIRVEHAGSVSRLTLDRPDARNALTPEMLDALARAASEMPHETRAVILRAEGPVFCSGFDLNLCRDDPQGSTLAKLLDGLSTAVTALRAQPCPVVAVVQGAAVAGGCALLGGADIVICAADARFGYPVTRLGISPAVSAPTLAAAVSGGSMRAMLLDPGLIDAPHARRLGLVSEILPDAASAEARARTLGETLAAKGPGAIVATRRLLQELSGPTPRDSRAALDRSLGLVGGHEERDLLPKAWAPRPGR